MYNERTTGRITSLLNGLQLNLKQTFFLVFTSVTGQNSPPRTEQNMKGIVLQLLCFCGKFPHSEVLCKKQLQNQALCTHALVVIFKKIEWDQLYGTSAQRKIQRLPSAPWSCSCIELWCAVTFIGWFHQLIYLINLDLTLYKGYVIKWCNSFLSHHSSQDLFWVSSASLCPPFSFSSCGQGRVQNN